MILRLLLLVAGGLVLALGLGCLNYTNAWNLDHHTTWAGEYGLPAPSPEFLDLGMGATAIGGIVIGFALGRRKR